MEIFKKEIVWDGYSLKNKRSGMQADKFLEKKTNKTN